MNNFWAKDTKEILNDLASSPQGLTNKEARERILKNGKNSFDKAGDDRAFKIFISQFKNPITIILIFASILSIVMGDLTDGLIILIIIMVSSILSFKQEYQANNAIGELLKAVSIKVNVLRDGEISSIDSTDVCLGDILVLSAGDMIPADSYIIDQHNLTVDESTLTGETFPVEKSLDRVEADTELSKRTNSLWMGTHIVSGTARALVVQLAKDTEFGKIAKTLNKRSMPTDFEVGIRKFGNLIMKLTVLMIGIIFIFNIILQKNFFDSFMFALALAVGLTPQMLPAIISVNLSSGAKRMSAKGVIVKKLNAIENFGAMTILCSDKTGTLTQGKISLGAINDAQGRESNFVRDLAFLNASLQTGYKNPIDQALASQGQIDLKNYNKIDEIPYSFETKALSILVNGENDPRFKGKNLLITKGALEVILSQSSSYLASDGQEYDIKDNLDSIKSLFENYSSQGFRVLGLAYKPMDKLETGALKEMIFAGFILLSDPIKDGMEITINEINDLGVSLKMITGDNYLIAKHIGEKVGLDPNKILLGSQISKLSPSLLSSKIRDIEIFAEISPEQKEEIILAYKNIGEIVGYMGDGINDAPAIKNADIGISVDTAADTAKDAASIVLLKNDLDVLIQGIIEGRKTFVNTLKYIFIATSANFGNMLSMAGASLALKFLPLLPKQILLTNLITDFPSLQIASDSVDKEWLERPVSWDMAFIKKYMIVFGLLSSVFDFISFFVLLKVFNAKESLFQTGWMFESVLSAMLVMLIIRTQRPFYKSKVSKRLVGAVIGMVVLLLILIYSPLSIFIGLSSLPLKVLFSMVLIAFLYAICADLIKQRFYKSNSFLKK